MISDHWREGIPKQTQSQRFLWKFNGFNVLVFYEAHEPNLSLISLPTNFYISKTILYPLFQDFGFYTSIFLDFFPVDSERKE